MAAGKERRPICEVEFYSGYKDRETPRAVWLDGRKITITQVLCRKRIRDPASQEIREVFTCSTSRGVLTLTLSESGAVVCRFKNGANRRI